MTGSAKEDMEDVKLDGGDKKITGEFKMRINIFLWITMIKSEEVASSPPPLRTQHNRRVHEMTAHYLRIKWVIQEENLQKTVTEVMT